MSGDGVVAHNRRTYIAENVDPTRTHLNIEYCYTPIEDAYHQLDDMAADGENAELAKTILDKFYHSFLERNPHLHVYSAHLHMDEATPHLHIDFIPFTTGSKRGLSTRVSLK